MSKHDCWRQVRGPAIFMLGTVLGVSTTLLLLSPTSLPVIPAEPGWSASRDAGVSLLDTEQAPLSQFVTVALITDQDDEALMAATTMTWGRRGNGVIYFVPRGSRDLSLSGQTVVEVEESLPLGVGVVQYMCHHLLNTSQWVVVVGVACYIQTRQLEAMLEQYDPGERIHWSYSITSADSTSKRAVGVCTKGAMVEVFSRGFLSAGCPSLWGCGNTSLERSDVSCLQDHCSLSAASPELPDNMFCPTQRQPVNSIQSHVLSSCVAICPLTDMRSFLLIHVLLAAAERDLMKHHSTALQQESDLMKYLLADATDILPLVSLSSSSYWYDTGRREEVKVWEQVEHGQAMSLLGWERLGGEWKEVADEGAERVARMLNTRTGGGDKYTINRVREVYWRVEEERGIELLLQLEVQQAQELRKFQARLVQPYTPLSVVSLPPQDLMLVVVVSDQFCRQLRKFLRAVGQLHAESGLSLSVLMIAMEDSDEVDRVVTEARGRSRGLSLEVVKLPLQLSRKRGLSLALQHLNKDTLLFLTDPDAQFDVGFLARCSSYPQQGRQAYFPSPYLTPSLEVQQQLSGVTTGPLDHWLTSHSSLACLYSTDLLSASMAGRKTLPNELEMRSVYGTLLEKGYRILSGPDIGLWRMGSQRRCGLIGEPCIEEEKVRRKEWEESFISIHKSSSLLHKTIETDC